MFSRLRHLFYCSCYNKLFMNSDATHKSMHAQEYRKLLRVNQAYVTQRVLLLLHDWVDGWEDELERMNDRKFSRPYKFPNPQ